MARERQAGERKGRGDDGEPRLPQRLERVKRPEGDPGASFDDGPAGYGTDYGRETGRSERAYGPFGGGGDVGRSHGDFPATPNETSQGRPAEKKRSAPANRTARK
jgi:hypothetical protein